MDITTATDGLFSINLKALMSANHITIRAIGAHMDVTHKRIRQIRGGALLNYLQRQDYRQAIEELKAAERSTVGRCTFGECGQGRCSGCGVQVAL